MSRLLLPLCVLLASTLHTAYSQTDCSQASIDLAIVVDGSGSICDNDPTRTDIGGVTNCNNWNLVRAFIRNIVNAVPIGSNDVRVGLITFANLGILEWSLDTYLDKASLDSAVNSLTYPGGNTNTSGAFKVMRGDLFNFQNGDRPNVNNVAIVITDGKSTFDAEQTLPQANFAQQEGVRMFAVGVTDSIEEAELRQLSSPPRQIDQTYFMSTDFEGLSNILQSLLEVTCVTQTPAPPTDGCGQLQVDLTFVVDGSGSICDTSPECIQSPRNCQGTCQNWRLVQQFMASTVDRLTIGPNFSKVAFVTFANSGELVFNLNEFTSKSAARDAVSNAAYPGGNTNTSGGLRVMHQQVYTAQSGDRSNVPNVALVITDGKSTFDKQLTIPEAVTARQQGIQIYAVGVTTAIDENELRLISSQPQQIDQNYFTSPDFEGLQAVLDQLLSVACETTRPIPTTPTTPLPVTGCRQPSDVVFVVDSSGSIREENFARIKAWMVSFINDVAVDEGQTRIGLVTFGDDTELRWNLERYRTRQELEDAINNLPFSHGTTNTGSALRYVKDNLFNGFNGDRTGIADIAVVLTDGGSNEKKRTWDEALRAKTQGMHLITVGMGDWIDLYELRAIASHPYQKNLFEVPNYDNLFSISQKLTDMVCNNYDECASFPCQNGGQCVDGIEQFFCVCPQSFGGIFCEYRCEQPADIVFALDASGSITKENFELVVEFTKSLINEMPVDTNSRVALMTFSDEEEPYFYLREYNNREDLMEALTIPYFTGGSTNTRGALSRMLTDFYTQQQGDIPGIPNVAVVITDGYSNDMASTLAQARDDRTNGINIIAIGVGDSIRDFELEGMASWPTDKNVYSVPNFSNLNNIMSSVRDAVCNAQNECNSNPCRNGGTCEDMRQGYYCRCPDGFTGQTCERACSGELDLAIVLDRSGSIRFERFEEVKRFLADVVAALEVWNDKVRVALVTFHDDAQLEFSLNTYSHIQDIEHHIMGVVFGGGRTNIVAAEDILMNQVFRAQNGDRQQVQNLVLMFTDGSSNIRADETLPRAIDLKIAGTRVMTVAVGQDLNQLELQGIVSRPSDQNLIYTQSFNFLQQQLQNTIAATCNDIDECASNPCRSGGQCVDDYRMYRCVCQSQFTGYNCDRRCRRQYDVVFLLDFSGSVDNAYNMILTLVREIMYGLEFRRDQVRAALITFDDDAELHFGLDKYQELRDYLTALAFQRAGGRTNTQDAFRIVRENVFRSQFGDRNGVQNKVILVTDGGSNVIPDQTVVRAADIKNDGADIHVVALGDQVDIGEVNQVASGTTEPFVYRIFDMSQVQNTASRMLDALCQ